MAPGPSAPSPLMPRSPSNLNIPSPQRQKSQSLAVRKSISKQSANEPTSQPKYSAESDLAEEMNAEIEAKYVRGKKLGDGTYAVVYQAHIRDDPSKVVAIKKFKIDPNRQDEGINVDTIREIKYLQEISHRSIVAVLDIFSSKDQQINMVIEYFPNGDMETLIRDKFVTYGGADIKAWLGMLCRAVYYCHSHFVLHRDIKPANLLIAANGEVKLADFGLARSFAGPNTRMTTAVCTIWYRSPELLFGARHYGGAIDIWAVGMTFAELVIRRPYAATQGDKAEDFAGKTGEINQIEKICEMVGTPTEDNWPGVSKLRDWFEPVHQMPLRDRAYFNTLFPTVGPDGVDLLMAMLKLDPRQRVTAKGALEHKYWQADPRPTDSDKLPKKGGGAENMAKSEVHAPGAVVVDEDKFKGVARKLNFGAS